MQLDYGLLVDDKEKISDLEYADDAALIAITLTNLASLLEELANESGKFGMKINT